LRLTFLSYLAGLGAIVTIMASFTGIFSQQLVQFWDCLQQDTVALVNISRPNAYNKIGGPSPVPVEYAPMADAINVGILQPAGDLTNLLSAGCSSGNCTFSDTNNAAFSTLAVSRSYTDITSRIRIVNETQNNASTSSAFTYLALDYGDKDNGDNDTLGLTSVREFLQSTGLMTVYFLFRSCNYERYWRAWRATNCSIFPTINTYAARIKDATLEERLIDLISIQTIFIQFDKPPIFDRDLDSYASTWTYMMTTNDTIRDGKRKSCEGSDSPVSGLVGFMKHSDEPSYINNTGYTNPSAG
jgi:hypothetical protein